MRIRIFTGKIRTVTVILSFRHFLILRSKIIMFGLFGKSGSRMLLRPRGGDMHLMYMAVGVGVFSGAVIFGPVFRELQGTREEVKQHVLTIC